MEITVLLDSLVNFMYPHAIKCPVICSSYFYFFALPRYQAPGSFDAFWRKNISNSDKNKLGSGGKTFKKGKSGLSDGAAVHTQSAKKQKRGDRRSGQSQMSQIELGAAQKGGQSQADRNVKPTSADSTQEESSKTKGSKGVKRKKNGKKTGKSPKPDVEMEVNQ